MATVSNNDQQAKVQKFSQMVLDKLFSGEFNSDVLAKYPKTKELQELALSLSGGDTNFSNANDSAAIALALHYYFAEQQKDPKVEEFFRKVVSLFKENSEMLANTEAQELYQKALSLSGAGSHDEESFVLTIKDSDRRNSPWCSKYFGLNNNIK